MCATLAIPSHGSTATSDMRTPTLSITPKGTRSDVVLRAQSGCHEAFSELYAMHNRRVFAICMNIVHDFALAEDLTQETFLQVHRKIASFRGDSVFTTWLDRLAVNSTLMHLRKRVLAIVSLDQPIGTHTEETEGRNIGERDLRQAGAVDRIAINRAVDKLAPGYRHVFLLHDVQGYDHQEIASMLNCSRGNTKSQLHKARRKLRTALESTLGRSASRAAPPPES